MKRRILLVTIFLLILLGFSQLFNSVGTPNAVQLEPAEEVILLNGTETSTALPVETQERIVTDSNCIAPCIFVDIYGEAGFRSQEQDIESIGGFTILVGNSSSVVNIFGYTLDEFTQVETAEWSSRDIYVHGEHTVGCNGYRLLSYEQIARLQTITAGDIESFGDDYMGICLYTLEVMGVE